MFFLKRSNKLVPIVREFYVLGTIIKLTVYGKNAEKAIEEAIERLQEIDDKMSVFKNYSDISNVNANAGILPQKVDIDTYFVIKKAVEYSELSGGAFDPTIRPLMDLWGFGKGKGQVPGKYIIKEKLNFVNYKNIILNKEDHTVMLKNKGQAIDFGGIAKGYAADEVKNIFLRNSIKHALIDLGGNLFVLGKKIDKTFWNIGIQHPLRMRGEYVGVINAANKSIVTSGNYERYFMVDGKRFHHILDPRTGYPSENGVISATIVSDFSIDGDALSTCLYVMGANEGIKFLESIDGVDGIVITEDKKVYTTSRVKDNFKLLSDEFIYEELG
ncbi:FAD:protein FMN transferase [Clostridium cylindrosporum]|uniref:FAD:protein FMN transferase n=1 Tax=Clostridium cylindrosporum DSM 605 TaxID=1121307 RepID=A0A0J8DBL1_CLOCY|nr:FAD:protein FMN transferase [Clostridium cylindrosporum]KMT23237.1 thiamine biosynthesis lipoprotein ApbE [Clostridium cylindrosporum DSM 605]